MTRPDTIAAQALHAIDTETGAIVPPLHLSTTYARDAAYALRHGRTYARDENPTFVHAEKVLAALEGGADAITLASGMTAATSVFRALCKPGDHVVASRACYFAMRAWLQSWSVQWQVAVDLVDTTDLDAVRAALRATTRVVWVETPANPTWDVSDIAAIAQLVAASGGATTLCVDSTAATPVHTRPLALGADLVMHSATKYLAGHSDVLAGALVTAKLDARWQAIRELRHVEGACLGPFEAWLLLRGMRTLYARVERQSRTAQRLAERLGAHTTVLYPGLPSHPQHAVARRQMTDGFGGMMSILTGGGPERALAVIAKLRVWVPATSLGGVESLVEHRRTAEGVHSISPPDLLRLSVGLEHEEDLYEDLAQALAQET